MSLHKRLEYRDTHLQEQEKNRKKLNSDVEEFLANGGEIEEVKPKAWEYGKVYSPAGERE